MNGWMISSERFIRKSPDLLQFLVEMTKGKINFFEMKNYENFVELLNKVLFIEIKVAGGCNLH